MGMAIDQGTHRHAGHQLVSLTTVPEAPQSALVLPTRPDMCGLAHLACGSAYLSDRAYGSLFARADPLHASYFMSIVSDPLLAGFVRRLAPGLHPQSENSASRFWTVSSFERRTMQTTTEALLDLNASDLMTRDIVVLPQYMRLQKRPILEFLHQALLANCHGKPASKLLFAV